MPTYQYSCTECGHFFEQFQSFSEESLTVCPQCKGRLRKVFNAVGVVFKGSGFYRTDSRASSTSGDSGSSSGGKDGGKDGSKDAGSSKTPAAASSASSASSSSSSSSSSGAATAGSAA